MTVRHATLADAGALAPLLSELGYPCSPDEISRRLTAMSSVAGAAVLVAADQACVMGVAAVQHLTVLHSNDPFAQLTLLVVASDARRRGVGRRLVAAAEDWAFGRGCVRMLVACGEQRLGAHAFYSSLGYDHTARRYSKLLGGQDR